MTDNKAPFDQFTVGHVVVGYLMGRGGLPWQVTLALSVGWELLEPTLKESYPEVFPNPSLDSESNRVVDVLAVMAGWYLASLT